jgi:two-component sensor histidine kinase
MISKFRIIPLLLLFLNTCLGEIPAPSADSSLQCYYTRLAKMYSSRSWSEPELLDSAFFFARKAVYLDDSANSNNNAITNRSLLLLGTIYFHAKNIERGNKIVEQVIAGCRRSGDKELEGDALLLRAKFLMYLDTLRERAQNDFLNSLSIYTAIGNNQKKIDATIEFGGFCFRKVQLTLADSLFHAALKDAEKCKGYRLQEIYSSLSLVHRYSGDFNQALNYSLAAVKLLGPSATGDTAANCYGELALVYQELGQPTQSIRWFRKCLDIRLQHPTGWMVYYTAYLMTAQLVKAGQAKQGIALMDSLSKLIPPKTGSEKASLYRGLAHCYHDLRDYARCERYFQAMMKENQSEKDGEVLMIDDYDVGKFYFDTKQYKKAEPFLVKAEELSPSTTAPRIIDLQYLLFRVDSVEGDLGNAIRHLNRYHAIKDSIFSEAKTIQIQELLIRYDAEKKDQDIQLLEKERKVERGDLIRANQTKNWIIGVAILLLVIVGLLTNNSRLKQRTNRKLHSQQEEIEKKNVTLEHLVREKDWLVREIHHRVKNNFHIVVGLLGTQSQYLKTEEAIKAMSESQNRVQAMSLIHQKLYQSDNLSAINMVDYLHELIGHLRHSFAIRQSILFRIDVEPIELGIAYSLPIGLIVNEAVTNSIKYAFLNLQAGVIYIALKQQADSRLLLIIRDNGCGLPVTPNSSNLNSMGMRLMRGLTEDMWGTFAITGQNGTEIRIEFSLENEEKAGSGQLLYNSILSV